MKKRFAVWVAVLSLVLVAFPSKVSIEGDGMLSVDVARASPDPGWVSPTSSTGNGWTNPDNAWDDNTVTYAEYDVAGASWSPYLELNHAALDCDKVQVWIVSEKNGTNIDTMELDVYYSGSYNNIYTGVVTQGQFAEYAIGSEQSVTAMRARFYNNHGVQNRWVYFYEADFWEVEPCSPDISNSPSTHDFGVVAESANYTTGVTNFTVTNNSGGAIDVSIQGTDMAGGTTWDLSDTATAGVNIYGLKAGLDDADDNYDVIVKEDSPYNDLITGLADSGTQDWGLQFFAPTSMDDGAVKTCSVTLTATCQ